jgi:hypothetical protein
MKAADALWHRARHSEKGLILLDFYGAQWKGASEVLSFAEICGKGGITAKSAIETLSHNLTKAADKGAGKYEITQRLLSTLVEKSPDSLAGFVVYLRDFSVGPIGSELMISAIRRSKPAELVLPLLQLEVGAGSDTSEEDENEGPEAKSKRPQTVAGMLALDDWAWRVLSCAISFVGDPAVVINDVLPNLLKDWRLLRESENGLRVLLRIVSPAPSVFRGIDFQGPAVNEALKNAAVPLLAPRALADIATLGLFPDGSRLVVALMKAVAGTDVFQQFVDAVFTDANVVDRALHKLVRAVVANDLVDAQFVSGVLERVGMADVLRSPGAWIVAELLKKAQELSAGVTALIKAEGIEGKAIDAILNPRDEHEFHRRKPFRKGRK